MDGYSSDRTCSNQKALELLCGVVRTQKDPEILLLCLRRGHSVVFLKSFDIIVVETKLYTTSTSSNMRSNATAMLDKTISSAFGFPLSKT